MRKLLPFAVLLLSLVAYGASFDCSTAGTKQEYMVCNDSHLSKLDDELDKLYKDSLSQANEFQKKDLIQTQRHWLVFSRNSCVSVTCMKHSYWSRTAELKNYFEENSPLYADESKKKELVQKVLAGSSLYPFTQTNPVFCQQLLSDLKGMVDIQFVSPTVQSQSYEDPKFDSWKRKCKSNRPFNFSYECLPNITEDVDSSMELCAAGYGIGPFKIYVLSSADNAGKDRFYFYSDDGYGPMNDDEKTPRRGGAYAGFHEFTPGHCDVFEGKGFAQASAIKTEGENNYNSMIEYKNQYYFFIFEEKHHSLWLSISSALSKRDQCSWGPIKM